MTSKKKKDERGKEKYRWIKEEKMVELYVAKVRKNNEENQQN